MGRAADFDDLVHHDTRLKTTKKMEILKRLLTSEIPDGLGDSLSSPTLYQEALQELESTYEHLQIFSDTYQIPLSSRPRQRRNAIETQSDLPYSNPVRKKEKWRKT